MNASEPDTARSPPARLNSAQADAEARRLAALHAYEVLDTPPERAFDDLTALTATLFSTPMVVVSLVDARRRWFKSRQGIEATETPRDDAFCDLAIRDDQVTVIPDTRLDARFASNPLVVGAPLARFYAAAPLITPDGVAVGALCVLDRRPRSFTPRQITALVALSRQVVAQLELRKQNAELKRSEAQLQQLVADLTSHQQAEDARRETQARYERLFTHSLDGVLQTRPGGGVLAANPAACAMLGLNEAQLCAAPRERLLDLNDPRLKALLDERERTGHASGEARMRHADGHLIEVSITSSTYTDRDGQWVSSVIFRDNTDRMRAEAQTHQLAYFDPLTGLPNRRLLVDRIGQALLQAQRSGEHGAVMFIDLDHFKHINDARGHALGDNLLQQVAQRLQAQLRGEDAVARLGGDEFVVLLGGLGADAEPAARHAMTVADKLRAELNRPYVLDGHGYGSSGTVGITLFPKAGDTPAHLLREADTAMYRAKAGGRNRIAFFEAAMQAEVEERFAIEQDLKSAITAQQLSLHAQPQFDAAGTEIGVELLLRWQHPVRGDVQPNQFIPIAEDTGQIHALGDWVLRRACEVLLRLRERGRMLPLSINVSPRQFRADDFVARVQAVLATTGAPADQLIFEVTENLLIDNWQATAARMAELVALGIRFSIDDFGTGYSSLSYLNRLPIYELKIDQSFVHDTPHDPNGTAIVASILSVARHLKLRVVAEGVETQGQADFLTDSHCDSLQGFLLARPSPLADWLGARLASGTGSPPAAAAH